MAVIAVLIVVGLAVVMLGGGALVSGKLTAAQIASYASSAGFSGPDLQVAVAVALAESSGNPGAVGDLTITPGGSVGLWQINLKYHPEFAGQDLTDPQTNANAAYSIYQAAGNSFSPWSTYNSGAYSAYIVQAQQGVNG
jgi:lysozyme-like protein